MIPIAPVRPEPAHDVFRHATRKPLEALFAPRTIALLGASEKAGSVGQALLRNLQLFDGRVFPINPKHQTVSGLDAFPNLAGLPEKVDLAVIATPAPTVPGLIGECAEAGVPAAIIISAGFKECGAPGVELEQRCLAEARRAKMRLLGPNCLGLMVPRTRLNATFADGVAAPGSVAFLSQSGALCAAVLDWSFRENVGFSAFVSVGSMLDIGWGDLITHFGDDPHTRSIVCYMESVGDARSFLSAAREVALTKPIVVLKVGRTGAAAKAAASHTGALTGSDAVLDAAFRRAGVLRVNTIGELFNLSELLAKQPRPRGPRLTMVTNAGGPGALATDALVASGGELASLSPGTTAALDRLLPPHWSHGNPIDILGDADATRYGKAAQLAAQDPQSDGVLIILTPQSMTDARGTAEAMRSLATQTDKPLFTSWMGGAGVDAGKGLLNAAGIPTFEYPDTAARAFALMWKYSDNLRALYETPALNDTGTPFPLTPALSPGEREIRTPSPATATTLIHQPHPERAQVQQAISPLPGGEGRGEGERAHEGREIPSSSAARTLITAARKAGRTLLTEVESKQILGAYGIPTVETHIALTEEEAVAHAGRLGFPVAVKLFSETLTHKTDVGGVQLDLRNAAAVRKAWKLIRTSVNERAGGQHFLGVTVQPMVSRDGYELILGSSIDPQFGPVIMFGTGGQLVEVFQDRALGLPPLNATLARRLMEQTRVYSALKGVRGRKCVDLAALEQLLVRFSQLVAEQRWIAEIDVNPLLVRFQAGSQPLPGCSNDTENEASGPFQQSRLSVAAADGDRPRSVLALDARIVLHPLDTLDDDLPRLAIRPYPTGYITPWKFRDGTVATIRPIRPEDEPLMVKFHETLSERSVYLRYFGPLKLDDRIAHERLSRLCFIDYDREMALVVERRDPQTHAPQILGVGRLSKLHGTSEAEFALTVGDQWQGHGLGTQLLKMLVQVGRDENLARITATILADNLEMQRVARKAGFTVEHVPGGTEYQATMVL